MGRLQMTFLSGSIGQETIFLATSQQNEEQDRPDRKAIRDKRFHHHKSG